MPDRYIRNQMHGVQGYLSQVDANIFSALMTSQTEAGIRGALAEIGIFFGRSFYLMGLHLQEGEPLYGADIFVEDHLSKSGSHYDDFINGARQFGLEVDDARSMFRGDSLDLDGAALKQQFGPARFFSIDGAHDLEHIRNDRDVAVSVLHDEGVIAFDDYCSPEWPDVTLAIFDLIDDSDPNGFDICAVSRKKAYVCRKPYVERYGDIVRQAPSFSGDMVRFANFKGRQIPFVDESYAMIVKQKLNDKLGRGVFSVL